MSFYGEMPDMFNMIVNVDHKLVKQVLENEEEACATQLDPINQEMESLNKRHTELHEQQEGKKAEEISTADKDELSDIEKKIAEQKTKKQTLLAEYASKDKVVKQLVDLALLQNNMLKGEALNNFIKRSIELI